MDTPFVTIIVPTYNRAALLKQCIGSLLLLSYARYEIVVVDDGSTDETSVYLESLGPAVRWVRVPHHGRSRARNVGIALSRGEVVAFTDDDCVAQPSWLRYLTEPLESASIAGVSGAVVYVHETYTPRHDERRVENRDARWPMTANCAYRTRLLRNIGGFDEGFERYEDKELALRVWQHGTIACVPEAKVFHQATQEQWPDMRYASSSAAWVRLVKMHNVRLDRNNPAPILLWCILMPRRYGALLKRLVYAPRNLYRVMRGTEEERAHARYELRWLRFLTVERLHIWRTAISEHVFLL